MEPNNAPGTFSRNAKLLIESFTKTEISPHHKKIVVNQLVSRFASWYEKVRNVMDYKEDEVILRTAIERILKRRIILGGDGKKIAEPLVRELVWARYFPDESLSEEVIDKISEKIDLYIGLKDSIIKNHIIGDLKAAEWMYHLMSSDIEHLLHPDKQTDVMANYMYQVIKNNVEIQDDTEQNRDVQVFIAVRRAFAKDDIAFLRFHLFSQFFGKSLTSENLTKISENFEACYKEIQQQLSYPRKDRIYNYVKGKTGIFSILEDLLLIHKEDIKELYENKEEFSKSIYEICQARYNKISQRIRTAIIRSVFFLLLTKAFFAFAIEGTYESIMYGSITWRSLLLNTGIPPLLMITVSFFLRAPKKDNSDRILKYITMIMSENTPKIGNSLIIKKVEDKRPILNIIFRTLWFLSYLLSFGFIAFVLTKLDFNRVSQGIFLFFLAIVSFLTYRISLMTKEYMVDGKQDPIWPVFDFFFMPIVSVGRHLTEGITQINIILFLFDFIIETPFKGIFGFFEQWFFYLHAKREEL